MPRSQGHRSYRWLVALGVALATIAGCAANPASQAPSGGSGAPTPAPSGSSKSIAVCLNADVTTLDVRVQTILNVRSVQGNIQDYPVQLRGEGDNLVVEPWLVTSWQVVDPLTWRLKLREGVLFHNGEPFNAEAFKYSIELQKAVETGIRNYVIGIKEVKVVDTYTVDLVTAAPSPLTIPNLSAIYIYPPKYTEEVGKGFSDHPIGTGPFVFGEWVKGDHITLTANTKYWNTDLWPAGPPVSQVTYRFCPDTTTKLAMLQRGEVQLIDNVQAEQIATIEADAKLKIYKAPGYKRIYLLIYARPEAGPLANPKVRMALNLAIDRDAIVSGLFNGLAVKYGGHTHTGLPCKNPDLKPYARDLDAARKLLTEAGVGSGFTVDLFTPVGAFPKDRDVTQAVAAQLAEVGIKANITTLEFNDYSTRLNKGTLTGLSLARRTTNTGDPTDSYRFNMSSKAPFNYIPDEKFDRLFEETETMTDVAARCAKLRDEVEPYLVNEVVPEVQLYDLVDVFGLSADLAWTPVNRRENLDLRGLHP